MPKISKGILDTDIPELKKRVLQLLHQNGPASRIQIANQLQISPATVGIICKDLIEDETITTVGMGKSTGGRRPTILQINERANFFIGCDLGVSHIISILADIKGNVIDRVWLPIDSRDELNGIIEKILSSIRTLIQLAETKQHRVVGIGLSMPGLLDIPHGISIFAPNLANWRNVPIVERVQQEFGFPVLMDNDARTMALGELWFGAGRNYRDIVCVNVGSGIGSGIIIGGQLYHGVAGGAGEIGHVTVSENGPRCSCGSNGCLELMASGPAIAARAIQAVSIGANTLIETLSEGNLLNVNAKIVAEAAKQGDKLAVDILSDAGRYVGIGVAMVVNLLSPGLVIIGGGVAQSGDIFFDVVRATVAKRAYTTIVNKPEIVPSELKDDASALGAVALFIHQTFGSSDHGYPMLEDKALQRVSA